MNINSTTRAAVEAAYTLRLEAGRLYFRSYGKLGCYKRYMEFRVALDVYKSTCYQARKEFADSRGLKYNPRKWDMDYPILDHVEFFDDRDGCEAAVLTHTYATIEEVEQYAITHNFDLEILPYSWHAPGLATAALFTPRGNAP